MKRKKEEKTSTSSEEKRKEEGKDFNLGKPGEYQQLK
jgi:hypothetical protein